MALTIQNCLQNTRVSERRPIKYKIYILGFFRGTVTRLILFITKYKYHCVVLDIWQYFRYWLRMLRKVYSHWCKDLECLLKVWPDVLACVELYTAFGLKKKREKKKFCKLKASCILNFFFFLVFGGCTETCTHPRPLLPEAHTFYNTCFQMFT